MRFGGEDRRLARAFGPDDGGHSLGLGRLDRGGEELLFASRRLELRELGLLLHDILRGARLGERTGLVRLGLCFRDDLPSVGACDLAVALGLDDHALGLVLLHGGFLRRARLRDACIALHAGEVLLAELLDVALRVLDARDRERVDVDAARLEVAARGLGYGLLEPIAVGDELLDREGPGDGAEGPFEDLLDHRLDLAVGLADESLGGRAQPFGLARDLEHRLSRDEHADALLRHGLVLVGESDLDLTCRELESAHLVDERPDERTGADDNLDALIVRGDELSGFVADRAAAGPGDDERFVRARHPVAAGREQREQDHDAYRREDQLCDGECHFGSLLSCATRGKTGDYGGWTPRTVSARPRTPEISTSWPRGMRVAATAGSVCTAPS